MDEEKAIEKLSTSDIECDIRVASGILNGFRPERQPELSRQEGNHNDLSLYCHLAQLLNVEEQSNIATTGSVTLDPVSGNVQAETIVVAANESDKFENPDRKDKKFEWESKYFEANESLDATEIKNTG